MRGARCAYGGGVWVVKQPTPTPTYDQVRHRREGQPPLGIYGREVVGGTGRSRADARRDGAVEAGATHRSHNLVHLGLLVIRGRGEDVVCRGGVGVLAVRLRALVVPPATDYVPDTVRIQER